MSDPLITELEVRRTMDCLRSHNGSALMGFSLRSSKPLTPKFPLYLPGCLNFPFKQPTFLDLHCVIDGDPPPPAQQTQFNSGPSASRSVVCKILEASLKEKLLHSLLTARQNDYPPLRSTVKNLLSAEETVTQWLDKGNTFDIVYLDFTRAFHLANHSFLVTKLNCYGVYPESYVIEVCCQGVC